MKINLFVTMLLAGLLIACGGTPAATTPEDKDGSLAEIGTTIADLNAERPITLRSTENLVKELARLSELRKKIETLPPSEAAEEHLSNIRDIMMDNCRILLGEARYKNDPYALEQFIFYATELRADREHEFGLSSEEEKKALSQ